MTDPKARAEVLKKIERILYDDAAIVPLHWQHLSWAARNNVRDRAGAQCHRHPLSRRPGDAIISQIFRKLRDLRNDLGRPDLAPDPEA